MGHSEHHDEQRGSGQSSQHKLLCRRVVALAAEMQADLVRNGIPEFYIEAIVGAGNMASRKIAEQVISNEPEAITEELSGQPAFKYVRRITS